MILTRTRRPRADFGLLLRPTRQVGRYLGCSPCSRRRADPSKLQVIRLAVWGRKPVSASPLIFSLRRGDRGASE